MDDGRAVHSHIKWLIALHLLVGIFPLATFSLPPTTVMLPVMWGLAALSIAQLMLLSVWVGASGRSWFVRLAGALGGTAYVSAWPVLAQYVSPHMGQPDTSFAQASLAMFASYAAITLLLSSAFLILQRWGTQLVHVSQVVAPMPPPRSQYSMLHLLGLMSICSLVLSLVKVAQPGDEVIAGFSLLALVAGYLLMFVIFLISSVGATWATLGPNSPWSRIAIALGISLLLGVAIAIASGNYTLSWWIFVAAALIPVVLTALVVGSLLVVRSCGYRFVPKSLLGTAQ